VLRAAVVRAGLYPNARVNRIARQVWPRGYLRLAGMPPDWSIGLLEGSSPFDLHAHGAVPSPVIRSADVADVPALLVADPFALHLDGRWHVYFEVVNARSAKGEIALATSTDLRAWTYEGVVLSEPFHLSYPFVFEWDGALHMVPETWESGTVRLYRATRSPADWELVDVLLRGPVLLDSTLVRHRDRWWMFSETNASHGYDTLRLFGADRLTGPWQEHPLSPIVRGDARIARPAGRVVEHADALVRYTQDCHGRYGQRVRAFEIHELSPDRYAEHPVDLRLHPGSWGVTAMHHVDAHRLRNGRWLAFVDGH